MLLCGAKRVLPGDDSGATVSCIWHGWVAAAIKTSRAFVANDMWRCVRATEEA